MLPWVQAGSATFKIQARPRASVPLNKWQGFEALKRTWLQPSISITEVGKGPRHQHGRHIANRTSCVISVRTPCGGLKGKESRLSRGQKGEDVVNCLKQHLRHELGASAFVLTLVLEVTLDSRFAKRRSCNHLELKTLAVSAAWRPFEEPLELRKPGLRSPRPRSSAPLERRWPKRGRWRSLRCWRCVREAF